MRAPRRLAALVALCVIASSAGCGSGDETPTDLDLDGGSSSGAASSSPTDAGGRSAGRDDAPPGVPPVVPAPEQGDRLPDEAAVYALLLPDDERKRAPAEGLVTYFETRTEGLRRATVDLDALARTAVGGPLSQAQELAAGLRDRGQHVAGDLWLSIEDDDVVLRGDSATLTDVCADNGSADVDADGVAQESPPDHYLLDATLTSPASGLWLVSSLEFTPARSC